jgi:hypothetical protein
MTSRIAWPSLVYASSSTERLRASPSCSIYRSHRECFVRGQRRNSIPAYQIIFGVMDVVRLSLIVQSALLRSCLAGARRARLAGVHAASSAERCPQPGNVRVHGAGGASYATAPRLCEGPGCQTATIHTKTTFYAQTGSINFHDAGAGSSARFARLFRMVPLYAKARPVSFKHASLTSRGQSLATSSIRSRTSSKICLTSRSHL